MNLKNELITDYTSYCEQKITKEFGAYSFDTYDPIYLYERYKCRIIEPRKRNVVESADLSIPEKYLSSYKTIKADISNGSNLKKYQSRKLKYLDFDDEMLSHWGIQHFHLSDILNEDGYVVRTSDLLFVHFTFEEAHIIGLFNHNSWCDLDIIEKLHENWPHELAVFKSNSDVKSLTVDEHKVIRGKNANTTVVVKDGTEYLPPGMGVTCNGVPIFAVINSDKIIYMLNSAFEVISENIQLILASGSEKIKCDILTIGMEVSHESKEFIYIIKETGFKFTLSSLYSSAAENELSPIK